MAQSASGVVRRRHHHDDQGNLPTSNGSVGRPASVVNCFEHSPVANRPPPQSPRSRISTQWLGLADQEHAIWIDMSENVVLAISRDVVESLRAKFEAVLPHLDERQQRLVMAGEARSLGHGGIAAWLVRQGRRVPGSQPNSPVRPGGARSNRHPRAKSD
jgi:hypothetical protein